jgi:hypothetical protein
MKLAPLALLVGSIALFAAHPAAADGSSDVRGGPILEPALSEFDGLVPAELRGTPSLLPTRDLGLFAWRCDAWPANGIGLPTFWISYSMPYSRAQALNACSLYNGYVCFFQCQLV